VSRGVWTTRPCVVGAPDAEALARLAGRVFVDASTLDGDTGWCAVCSGFGEAPTGEGACFACGGRRRHVVLWVGHIPTSETPETLTARGDVCVSSVSEGVSALLAEIAEHLHGEALGATMAADGTCAEHASRLLRGLRDLRALAA
jgi:hypothetical protein